MQEPFTSSKGRGYRVRAHVPDAAPPDAGYPLVWLLDAPTTWAPMQQALHGQEDSAVVLGIDWEIDGKLPPGLRRRDFTSPALHEVPPPRGPAERWDEDGDADAFLEFILQTLQPHYLDRLPVNRRRQTLAGHSLSGLFVLQVLLRRPDAFAGFVAASPSIWWDGKRIMNDAKGRSTPPATVARVLLTVGSDEQVAGPEKPPEVEGEDAAAVLGEPHMVDYAAEFSEQLRAAGVDCRFQVFEGETHHSVVPASMAAALEFACALGGGASGQADPSSELSVS
ncbi:MAG: alpha/beta hydrolase-fold protein [Pseudomonadota bacterium]|nr:alpha/beta hydrolase-fold protein [Pseudomonadota bacterium]